MYAYFGGNQDAAIEFYRAAQAAGVTALDTIGTTSAQLPKLQTSFYYGADIYSIAGTAAPTLSRVHYTPWQVPSACTINQLGIESTVAAGAGGVIRLGLYADNGSAVPGALLVETTALDTTVPAAFISEAVDVDLDAGLYWFASCAQVAAATFRSRSGHNPFFGRAIAAGQVNFGGYFENGVAGALPATAAVGTNIATTVPDPLARVSALL